MAGRDALQAEIAAAMRRVELAEARVAGLIRAWWRTRRCCGTRAMRRGSWCLRRRLMRGGVC